MPVTDDAPPHSGDYMGEPTLRILSVYEALDGEANAFHQGCWTVFVRTAGCAVGCRWCDTMYSWSAKRGRDYGILELVGEIAKVGKAKKITLTGGEPLEQPIEAVSALFHELITRGYKITIETAGTEPVAWLKRYSPNVGLVLDYKLPSSQVKKEMVLDNFRDLEERHVVKFVVADETDYQEMIAVATWMRIANSQARLVMSPLNRVRAGPVVYNSVATLAEWVEKMKRDGLSSLGIGLNVQLHKIIYSADAREEESGGVDYSDIHKKE